MFCSTIIIATAGRPTVAEAVYSILNQDFTADSFEIIVANDGGTPLPPASWMQSEQVQILNTQQRGRSVARNTGAMVARGEYLHFLDDGDVLLPGALNQLWALAGRSEAAWLYGGAQLVDHKGALTELHPGWNGNCFVQFMAGAWIPLPATLIRAAVFKAVGGFDPLLAGIEEVDLGRRLAQRAELAGTGELVARIDAGQESSPPGYKSPAIDGRGTREKILEEPGVFGRMRASATSACWHGRLARLYLASMAWNLRRRSFFTAASRATYGLATLPAAGIYLFTPGFWRALVRLSPSEMAAGGAGQVEWHRDKEVSGRLPTTANAP